jgi:hypothetical protein
MYVVIIHFCLRMLIRASSALLLATKRVDDLTATERAACTHPDAPPHLPPYLLLTTQRRCQGSRPRQNSFCHRQSSGHQVTTRVLPEQRCETWSNPTVSYFDALHSAFSVVSSTLLMAGLLYFLGTIPLYMPTGTLQFYGFSWRGTSVACYMCMCMRDK